MPGSIRVLTIGWLVLKVHFTLAIAAFLLPYLYRRGDDRFCRSWSSGET